MKATKWAFYFLTVTFGVPIDDDIRGGSEVRPLP